jgi:hypothetical protein
MKYILWAEHKTKTVYDYILSVNLSYNYGMWGVNDKIMDGFWRKDLKKVFKKPDIYFWTKDEFDQIKESLPDNYNYLLIEANGVDYVFEEIIKIKIIKDII